MKEDLADRIKKWYYSYESSPPWTSVLGLLSREIKKSEKRNTKQTKENILYVLEIINKERITAHEDKRFDEENAYAHSYAITKILLNYLKRNVRK